MGPSINGNVRRLRDLARFIDSTSVSEEQYFSPVLYVVSSNTFSADLDYFNAFKRALVLTQNQDIFEAMLHIEIAASWSKSNDTIQLVRSLIMTSCHLSCHLYDWKLNFPMLDFTTFIANYLLHWNDQLYTCCLEHTSRDQVFSYRNIEIKDALKNIFFSENWDDFVFVYSWRGFFPNNCKYASS